MFIKKTIPWLHWEELTEAECILLWLRMFYMIYRKRKSLIVLASILVALPAATFIGWGLVRDPAVLAGGLLIGLVLGALMVVVVLWR